MRSLHFKTSLLLATIVLAFSCKTDDDFDSPYCRSTQDLGNFQPAKLLAHQAAASKVLTTGSATGQLQINQPADLQQFNQAPSEVLNFVYDCNRYFSEIKYTWSAPQKKAVLAVQLNGTTTWLLIRQTVVLDETQPGKGPIGTATELFAVDNQAVNTFRTAPFTRIMTEPKLVTESDSLKLNVQFSDTLTLAGKLYQNVYQNTTNLLGEVHKYYYTEQQGVVGVKDRYGMVWRVE